MVKSHLQHDLGHGLCLYHQFILYDICKTHHITKLSKITHYMGKPKAHELHLKRKKVDKRKNEIKLTEPEILDHA